MRMPHLLRCLQKVGAGSSIRPEDSPHQNLTHGAGGTPFGGNISATTEGAPSFAVSKGWAARYPIPFQL
jgi:hypothetical protein